MKIFALALFLFPVFLFSEKIVTEEEFKKTLYDQQKAVAEDSTEKDKVDYSQLDLKELKEGCSLKEKSLCDELKKRCRSGNKDACNTFVSIEALLCENKDSDACARLKDIYDYDLKVEGKVVFKKNYQKAVEYAKKACDLSEDYCSILGAEYLTGTRGQRQDAKAGEFFLNKSCSSGNFLSCHLLGDAYTTGKVLAKNHSLAFKYYFAGCKIAKASMSMPCRIAFKYEKGEDVPLNYSYAFKFYDFLCASGEPLFCGSCGNSYEGGKGVKKDLKQALLYYEKGCNLGDADSCGNIARFYYFGIGVKKVLYLAVDFYKKSCDLGSPLSCFNLAILYRDGDGVPKSSSVSDKMFFKSAKLFKEYCNSGVEFACDEYAKLYDMGFGVDD